MKSKHLTPTQSARLYGIRAFGPTFWFTAMTEASRKQLTAAYIAGVRHGRRNGK